MHLDFVRCYTPRRHSFLLMRFCAMMIPPDDTPHTFVLGSIARVRKGTRESESQDVRSILFLEYHDALPTSLLGDARKQAPHAYAFSSRNLFSLTLLASLHGLPLSRKLSFFFAARPGWIPGFWRRGHSSHPASVASYPSIHSIPFFLSVICHLELAAPHWRTCGVCHWAYPGRRTRPLLLRASSSERSGFLVRGRRFLLVGCFYFPFFFLTFLLFTLI